MTTHRRAALVRAGVAAAVALATLAIAAPAYADDVNLQLSQSSFDLGAGDSKPLTVRLENTTDVPNPNVNVTVSVPSGLGDVQVQASDPACSGSGSSASCKVALLPKRSKDVAFTLVAKDPSSVPPGETKQGTGNVQVDFGGQKSFSVTLRGPQKTQAPTVASVSGVVRDMTTGNPVKNATVVLADSGACGAGNPPCQTGTDAGGNFKFTPASLGKAIAPGTIQVGAGKTGYEQGKVQADAKPGQAVNVSLKLKPTADASASASAEAAPTPEAQTPTADAAAPTTGAAAAPKNAANSSSAMSWIILVLAGMLVLAGVGVFVVMFLNRKKGDDEDPDRGPAKGPQGGPSATATGLYGGGAGDRTMVGHPGMTQAGMAVPGTSDATAIIHPQHPEDEFPDPYAAPYPTSSGGYAAGGGYAADPYATQTGGYSPGQPAGYDPGYGGAPTAYGPGGLRAGEYGGEPAGYNPGQGYGPGSGGGAQRYDEATRHWDGPGAGGYANGPTPPEDGYDPRSGHDPAGYPPQDPYYQQPPQAPARRGAPPASGRGGDQRLDWLDD